MPIDKAFTGFTLKKSLAAKGGLSNYNFSILSNLSKVFLSGMSSASGSFDAGDLSFVPFLYLSY